MNDNIWHLRSRLEDALNPIFEMFDERQHCLLGTKQRTNMSELQYDADKLDMALLLLCERMPHYAMEPEPKDQSALSVRELVELVGGHSFQISVNPFAGYDLVVHAENGEEWLRQKGLKLTAVIGTVCNLFFSEVGADPDDTYGILSFAPSETTGR